MISGRPYVPPSSGSGGGPDPALEGRVTAVENDVDSLRSADTALDGRVDALETAASSLDSRLDAIEAAPPGGDTSALEGRIATAEGEIDALQAAASSLDSRLDALEAAPAGGDTSALEGRIATAEGEIDALQAADVALDSRLDALQAYGSEAVVVIPAVFEGADRGLTESTVLTSLGGVAAGHGLTYQNGSTAQTKVPVQAGETLGAYLERFNAALQEAEIYATVSVTGGHLRFESYVYWFHDGDWQLLSALGFSQFGHVPGSETRTFLADTNDIRRGDSDNSVEDTLAGLESDVMQLWDLAGGGGSDPALVQRISDLETAATSLDSRIDALEAAPAGGDTSALEGRITTAEGDIDALQAADTGLANRIQALEDAPAPTDYGPSITSLGSRAAALEAADDALESRVGAVEAAALSLDGRIDALEAADVALDGRIDAHGTQIGTLQQADVALDGRIDALAGRVDALEASLPAVPPEAATGWVLTLTGNPGALDVTWAPPPAAVSGIADASSDQNIAG